MAYFVPTLSLSLNRAGSPCKTFKYDSLPLLHTMGRDNKISMPSGIGGLTRYFDEYKSRITIKPGHVVILCIVIIILLLFLQMRGMAWLGI